MPKRLQNRGGGISAEDSQKINNMNVKSGDLVNVNGKNYKLLVVEGDNPDEVADSDSKIKAYQTMLETTRGSKPVSFKFHLPPPRKDYRGKVAYQADNAILVPTDLTEDEKELLVNIFENETQALEDYKKEGVDMWRQKHKDAVDKYDANLTGFDKFANRFIKGATAVADYGVEHIIPAVAPGAVSEAIGKVYKNFGPPTSKFYNPDVSVADKVKATIGLGRRRRGKGQCHSAQVEPIHIAIRHRLARLEGEINRTTSAIDRLEQLGRPPSVFLLQTLQRLFAERRNLESQLEELENPSQLTDSSDTFDSEQLSNRTVSGEGISKRRGKGQCGSKILTETQQLVILKNKLKDLHKELTKVNNNIIKAQRDGNLSVINKNVKIQEKLEKDIDELEYVILNLEENSTGTASTPSRITHISAPSHTSLTDTTDTTNPTDTTDTNLTADTDLTLSTNGRGKKYKGSGYEVKFETGGMAFKNYLQLFEDFLEAFFTYKKNSSLSDTITLFIRKYIGKEYGGSVKLKSPLTKVMVKSVMLHLSTHIFQHKLPVALEQLRTSIKESPELLSNANVQYRKYLQRFIALEDSYNEALKYMNDILDNWDTTTNTDKLRRSSAAPALPESPDSKKKFSTDSKKGFSTDDTRASRREAESKTTVENRDKHIDSFKKSTEPTEPTDREIFNVLFPDDDYDNPKKAKGRKNNKKCRHYKGGALAPLSLLHKIATASYNPPPPADIENWKLVGHTPTLTLYRKGEDTIVGVRGTKDSNDWKANASIAVNKLNTSNRFRTDLKNLKEFKAKHPNGEWTAVGHSLGGAIIDEFLNLGLISSAVSYNPAVEPKNFKATLKNKRIYAEGDPLFELYGPHIKGYEVRKSKTGVLGKMLSEIPLIGKPLHYHTSHKLNNFEGGGIFSCCYDSVKTHPSPEEIETFEAATRATIAEKLYNECKKLIEKIYFEKSGDTVVFDKEMLKTHIGYLKHFIREAITKYLNKNSKKRDVMPVEEIAKQNKEIDLIYNLLMHRFKNEIENSEELPAPTSRPPAPATAPAPAPAPAPERGRRKSEKISSATEGDTVFTPPLTETREEKNQRVMRENAERARIANEDMIRSGHIVTRAKGKGSRKELTKEEKSALKNAALEYKCETDKNKEIARAKMREAINSNTPGLPPRHPPRHPPAPPQGRGIGNSQEDLQLLMNIKNYVDNNYKGIPPGGLSLLLPLLPVLSSLILVKVKNYLKDLSKSHEEALIKSLTPAVVAEARRKLKA